jgi:anaerobic ribonucleoside-triphosphate reductase activating protein
MFIKRIIFPIKTLGPGNRVGIWVTGCNRSCEGCMSPELQSQSNGVELTIDQILNVINQIDQPIQGFTISGGEPLLQSEELSRLIRLLNQNYSKDIILFTGYVFEELREFGLESINSILENISVLIDGPYISSLNDGIGLRGSSNQRIHILENCADYNELNTQRRTLQSFRYNGKILLIGIQ